MSLLICDATVIDGVADKPTEGQSIWIEEGRIKAIGPRPELRVPASVKVVEARGKYVIPGLMNADVHLLGDIRLEQLVRYEGRNEDVIAEAAQVTLKNGVTTVFDTWGPRQALMKVRDSINSGRIPGSRIFCSGNIIGLDGPFSADFLPNVAAAISDSQVQRMNAAWVENVGPDLTWMTPDLVVDEVRAYVNTGIDFVKYASSDHRAGERNAFLLFSPLVQSSIVAEAHRAGLTVQAHAASNEALRVALEAGSRIHYNVTGRFPIPRTTIELIVDRRAHTIITAYTERRLKWLLEKRPDRSATWHSTVANTQNLIRVGGSLLLGTDGVLFSPEAATDPVVGPWLQFDAEDGSPFDLGTGHFYWLKAMEENGMSALDGLRAATANIAQAYGIDADLGVLQPGKMADMLVLARNPLESARNYRSIETIIKSGKIIDPDSLPTVPVLTKPAPQRFGTSQSQFTPGTSFA